MKSIAIDFGTRKCGVAVSDDTGTLALPLKIVETKDMLTELGELFTKHRFEKIVIGESVNSQGLHNDVFEKTKSFVEKLKKRYELEFAGGLLDVVYEKEFMTSKHARQEDGKHDIDDRAAALILQRFLDRENIKNKKALEKKLGKEKVEEDFDDEDYF